MADYTVGDTVYKRFTTRAFATGIPGTLGGTPVVSAYEDDSITQITAGITLGVDHDGVTGLNLLTIVATGANGFEVSKSYDFVITTGTVDSVSVVGEVVWHFTLSAEAAAVDLANGTDGLGALKTLLDAIPTTMRGTDNAALASVVGALNDVAAADEVTTADTLVQYIKQLINILIGAPGIATFPAEAAPGDGVSLAEVIRAIHVDTSTTLDGRIPAALVGGRIDATVDSTGMESGAVDAVWAKAMTELAAVPGVTGTVLAALEWIFLLARNKGTQTTTTKTLRNDADDGDIATSAISDDGTTFTRGEWS